MTASAQETGFCAELLKSREPDWYFASLFLPERIRSLAQVLYAFDSEIARIADLVSEPMPGEIRIQWWRDVIAGKTSGDAAANPLSAALLAKIQEHDLPQKPFQDYLDARVFDLYHDPMPDTATLEGYCGETASIWPLMVLRAQDEDIVEKSADFCGHAGMVSGISRVLSRLERDRRNQRCYVPMEVLQAAGLTTEAFYSSPPDAPELRIVFEQMKRLLKTHFEAMTSHATGDNRLTMIGILPLAKAVMRSENGASIRLSGPFGRRFTIGRAAITGLPTTL